MTNHARPLTLLPLALLLAGCSTKTSNVAGARDNAPPGAAPDAAAPEVGGRDGAAGDAASALPGPFDTNPAGQVLCGDTPCVCNNGLDDDGDGLVDGFDPECTGPYDDDEGSFATGIPGDNKDPKCQDCFFDGNSGSGDDGCRYATSCLTSGTAESGSGSCNTCEASDRCVDFCRPRTPNGCDCYGCCQVVGADGTVSNVQLTAQCSLDRLDDPSACQPCVQSADCRNDCGRCELCPGRTAEDIPADCASPPPADAGSPSGTDGGAGGGPDAGQSSPPPPVYQCDDGEVVCSPERPCDGGFYCQQGCCLPVII